MNYQIIKDEEALKAFIDWLPELGDREKYYMCLFARNKYCKQLTHIKTDKAQLKRFVTDKDRMYKKIKQLEIEVGCYFQKETPVPEEGLALYITPNPRDMYKATINTMVKIANGIRDQNVLMNAHQEALSEIQSAKSRTVFVDFDVDTKDDVVVSVILSQLDDLFLKDGYHILETRGGYHILVEPNKAREVTKWYQTLKKFADQAGDQMIPVPGCTQGGFVPKFLSNGSTVSTTA